MISEELKVLYTSDETSVRYFDCITLTHPNFTQDWHFIQDHKSRDLELSDTTLVTFIPYGFDVVLPTVGSNQQDMKITLDNTNLVLVSELNLASANITVPIVMTHNTYIEGFLAPQASDLTLNLTNIAVNNSLITASASATDLVNRKFLSKKYDSRFKGLNVK